MTIILALCTVTPAYAASGDSMFKLPSMFLDVSDTHWAKSYINQAYMDGYIIGYKTGEFQPEKTISKAEFMSILSRINNTKVNDSQELKEIDGHWAEKDMLSLLNNGILVDLDILHGFKPDDPITRKDIAKLIAKSLAFNNNTFVRTLDSFKDSFVPLKDYKKILADDYSPYISIVFGTGIMVGKDDNRFDPDGLVTRAEASKVITDFVKAKGKAMNEFPNLLDLKQLNDILKGKARFDKDDSSETLKQYMIFAFNDAKLN
ncbi:S-layer homology domain-containing protein [Paenibacillus sp. N1-5-1-14]|uniref:S-layer homology domain-containing protein n=1 Tax=Paenibacillus radicibacter TaxID=2972488 RepID=UPI0021594F4D|nr:S-layer homology domain-containing protein [Paenibacillus radicibacter]MCR8644814.1 S-layer homology domain-containing protein [Paenibacillus radicibacter]